MIDNTMVLMGCIAVGVVVRMFFGSRLPLEEPHVPSSNIIHGGDDAHLPRLNEVTDHRATLRQLFCRQLYIQVSHRLDEARVTTITLTRDVLCQLHGGLYLP